MVAAAIGVAGGLGAVGSLGSGLLNAGAASAASAAQIKAQQEAIQTQEKYFGIGKGELQPFQSEGVAAGGQLGSLLGLNGGGSAGALGTLENLPGYQFTLGQAQQAQAAGITARGLGLSGAQERGASDYAQGAAQTNYTNYATQLQNLMGLGEQAGAGIASDASAVGTGIAASQVGVGNAQAAGLIGQAQGYGQALSGTANAIGGAASAYGGYNFYQGLAAQQGSQGGMYANPGTYNGIPGSQGSDNNLFGGT